MRYYELTLSLANSATSQVLQLKLDESNAYGLRITFNIQAFQDAALYVPSVLTIYNPSTSYFTNAHGLEGAKVMLRAGIKPSPLTSKLDLTPSLNDLLYIGVVARAVPDYMSKDPSIALLLSPVSFDAIPEPFTASLNKGEKVGEFFKKVLTQMFSALKVVVDVSAESVTLQDKTKWAFKVTSLDEVLSALDSFNLKVATEGDTFTIMAKKANLERAFAPFKPKAQDFIAQPEWQTLSELQCSFALRSDLKIGQKVIFDGTMATSAQSLVSEPSSLSGITHTNALLLAGEFEIVSIWHQGDSRGIGSESWATNVLLMKPEANLVS